ncbi:MAG: extracellular solute-binding protein [Lachnospiraceae bacterium]|nr:extracellular solute-binding protein [Lachnospiraceae bacterium]
MQNKKFKKSLSLLLAGTFTVSGVFGLLAKPAEAKEDVIVLRVCNWEEYIDEGDWDEEEVIELENGESIFGENALVNDFEDWYYETYGQRVKVEYSCAGTNEELYTQLTLGDTYDLVCPSDYMMMKLMAEDWLEPFSEGFFDTDVEYNYYSKGVSPYITDVFREHEIDGETWERYGACYMWGTTGVLYNPEYMTEEEASTWAVFNNRDFFRQVTLKDNVRDTYFAALGLLKADLYMSEEFRNREDYEEALYEEMNDTTPETMEQAEDLLQEIMGNVYALETDSGKADMVTGKIVANYQWSGDAVYAIDLAEEDDVYLKYAVPKECTNLWFDAWVMLKDGIAGDPLKKQAAEAFVNFVSRPDNAVRNMYYIGYTSAIAGGDDDTIISYVDWSYGAEEDAEETFEYPLGYFFSGDNEDEDYIIVADVEQQGRQLTSQYPSKEEIHRTAIMNYFDEEQNARANQMWINIRCFNISRVPVGVWITLGAVIIAVILAVIFKKKK